MKALPSMYTSSSPSFTCPGTRMSTITKSSSCLSENLGVTILKKERKKRKNQSVRKGKERKKREIEMTQV